MEKEIKIRDLFTVIKKRLWVIVLATLLMTAASGLYTSYTLVPLYQSSTKFLINLNDSDKDTLAVIAKDHVVLDKVIEQLGLTKSSDQLSGQISFSTVSSNIASITAVDPKPEVAAQLANTTTNVFIQQIGNILGIYDTKMLSEATVGKNPSPINSKPRKNMDIGFGVGLVLGIGVVLLLDSMDEKLRSEREIRQLLGLPVLGSVSRITRRTLKGGKAKQVKGVRQLDV